MMSLLRLRVVLVPVDATAPAGAALRTAAALARASGSHLVVLAVDVRDVSDAERVRAREALYQEAESYLPLVHERGGATKLTVLPGRAWTSQMILSTAERESASVIVLGVPSGATTPDPWCEMALDVAASALAPCLLLNAELTLPIRRVLTPIDFSVAARGALAVALAWASALRPVTGPDLNMVVLHIDRSDVQSKQTGGTQASLERRVASEVSAVSQEATRWGGVAVEICVTQGADAPTCILSQATDRDAQMIVIGTRGLTESERRTVGSVSAGVALRAAVPVLLVPPSVWQAATSGDQF